MREIEIKRVGIATRFGAIRAVRRARQSLAESDAFGGFLGHFFDIRDDKFERDFIDRSHEYGHCLAKKIFLGDSVESLIKRIFFSDEVSEQVVLLRGLLPTRRWSILAPSVNDWFIKKRVYDLLAACIIHKAGLILRKKREDETPYRDFHTNRDVAKSVASDGGDLPLRYRTATPELRFRSAANVAVGDLAAGMVVLCCIYNPSQNPIYLINIKSIVDRLKEYENKKGIEIIKYLRSDKYSLYDRLDKNFNVFGLYGSQAIMAQEEGCDVISYDVNRLSLASIDNAPEHKRAVGYLQQALMEIDESAEPKEVFGTNLSSGDMLIWHNQKMLYCRKERRRVYALNWLFNNKNESWFKAYYGFPHPYPS